MNIKRSLASLHERLNSIQDEFQHDLSLLISELESALNAADELGSIAANQDQRVKRLEARAEGQNSVIETLSQEAQESHGLRSTVRERDLEIARLTRELDTKNDLINALRRQLESGRTEYGGSPVEEAVRAKSYLNRSSACCSVSSASELAELSGASPPAANKASSCARARSSAFFSAPSNASGLGSK